MKKMCAVLLALVTAFSFFMACSRNEASKAGGGSGFIGIAIPETHV